MRIPVLSLVALVGLLIPVMLWRNLASQDVNRAQSRGFDMLSGDIETSSNIRLNQDATSGLRYSFPRPSGKCNRDFPPFECCPHVDPKLLTKPTKSSTRPKMLIGIGSMKGGSSFIFNLLKQHPNIASPRNRQKELHFFNHVEIDSGGLDAYLRKWGWNGTSTEAFEGKTLMEMTPQTMMLPWAPCYFRKWLPDAKFLLVLRNPVARAISQVHFERQLCLSFRHNGDCCGPYARSFNASMLDALGELLIRNQEFNCLFNDGDDSKTWPDCFNNHWWRQEHRSVKHISTLTTYLSRGFYAAQLAWWLEFFPPSQIILVKSENLYKNPLKETNRVLRFIGEELLLGDGPGHFPLDLKNVAQYKTPPDPTHEPDLDKVIDQLIEVYRPSNQEFYQLLREHGLDFEEFDDSEISRDNGLVALNTSLAIDPKGCRFVV
ncbi:hypothetical protein BSKO_12071 [Bryopsis sp. KO-2023]|nr:hypothetical protein BSKO_12071 [Bryopsis sp. KO-2023]